MDIPAVDSDWSLLAELLLRLVHLPHKVGELPAQLGHALLGPVGELELAHGARLAVPRVRHLELAQEVLRHVVLCQGVHHKVSGRKSIKYIFLGLGSVRLNKNNKLEKEN